MKSSIIIAILSLLFQLATKSTGQYVGSGAMGAAIAGNNRGPLGYGGGSEAIGMGWTGSYSPAYSPLSYGPSYAGNVPAYRPGQGYPPLLDPTLGSPYSTVTPSYGAPIYPGGAMTSAYSVGAAQGGISPISYSPPMSPGFTDATGALAYGSAYAPSTYSSTPPLSMLVQPQSQTLNENENANTNININHDMGMHRPSLLGQGLLGLPRMQ